jgi:hypothetical protein
MGIHILVVNKDLKEHPDWDYIRVRHDKEFEGMLYDNIKHNPDAPSYADLFKPVEIDRIRKDLANTGWDNVSRYEKLLDIIADDEWWLEISC